MGREKEGLSDRERQMGTERDGETDRQVEGERDR